MKKLFADGGYQGPIFKQACKEVLPHVEIKIVKWSDTAVGFEVIPRRWVVERTLARLGRCRRLAKDVENRTRTAHAFLMLRSYSFDVEKALFENINLPDGLSENDRRDNSRAGHGCRYCNRLPAKPAA